MALSRRALATLTGVVLTAALLVTTLITGALAAPARPVNWVQMAPAPTGSLEGTGIEFGGKLYTFGGYDTTYAGYRPTPLSYVYDPVADKWSSIADLPAFNGTGHGGITHAGIAADKTSIYLAGGYSANAAGTGQIFGAKDVYKYTPATNTYTRLPDLPAERAAGGMAVVGGKLFYFGGTNHPRTLESTDTWMLDLANTAAGWVSKAPLPLGRNHLGARVIGGKVYVVGGQRGQDAKAISQSALDVYDPKTNVWQTLPSMPQGLSHTVATDLDGNLIVMGGQVAFNAAVTNTWAYDPATQKWQAYTALPNTRYSGVAATLGGAIYYAGGSRQKTTYRGIPIPLTTPVATPTPKPTGPTPTKTPVPSTTPVPTKTAVPSTTPVPTKTPVPTATPVVTATPKPTATPAPTPLAPRAISFQPATSVLPGGYTADTGAAYSDAAGSGWIREDSLAAATHVPLDLTLNTRERDILGDQRLDTFIQMQAAGTNSTLVPGVWELSVPNGSYEVTVAVGDPKYLNSTNTIHVEGVTAIDGFVPTAGTTSQTATVTVPVTDGRLTVDAVGGTNTKLDYVTVKPAA